MQSDGLLTRKQCEETFDRVVREARHLGVNEVEAIVVAGESALTRFANNTIHQNVAEKSGYLSVRTVLDGRTARATTNRLDDDSIRSVVQNATEITRLQAPDPQILPLAEPQPYTAVERWFRSTAETRPVERARAVRDAIAAVESEGQAAAGIYSTGQSALALLNSRGLFAYHTETMAQFSITAMAEDSSGWAKASACDSRALNPRELASMAAQKAKHSRAPAELTPGRYTVILEPAAVLDLVGQMFGDFSATSIRDERSFLTGRLGQTLFGTNIHIHDDVYHPQHAGAPFDGEGVPKKRLALVEAGTVHEVAYSRAAAQLAGFEPTGHGFPLPNEYGEAPMNIVIEGGESSVEQMIASTERGILVTRLWYIREVDPFEKIMTGMTRDGTFLIENGRLTRGLRNFRFNQSLLELLSNVEAMSPAIRTSGEEAIDMVAPALKARDFHFTEVTRF